MNTIINNTNTFEQKLAALVEKHQYPQQQHTTADAAAKAKPTKTDVDYIAALKKGTKIGYLDICPLGIPKAFFKALQTKLAGAPYTSHEMDQQLCIVDRFFYTKKHMVADALDIPCINFDVVLNALATTEDEDIKKFLASDDGRIFNEKVQKFMEKGDKKPAKTEEKPVEVVAAKIDETTVDENQPKTAKKAKKTVSQEDAAAEPTV